MKPLVLWCRWHDAKLRLHGRSADEIWGELVFPERNDSFRYHLETRTLIVDEGQDQYTIHLDEMGVEMNNK